MENLGNEWHPTLQCGRLIVGWIHKLQGYLATQLGSWDYWILLLRW